MHPVGMATSSTTTIRDVIAGHHDDGDFDFDFIAEEEEDDEEEDEWEVSKRMARLSIEGSDGGDADDEGDVFRRGNGLEDEEEEEDDDVFEVRSDVDGATYGGGAARGMLQLGVPSSASLPGTPDRAAQLAGQSPMWPGPSGKDYASETEARWAADGGGGGGRRRHGHHPHQHYHYHRRERMMREVWLERAWRARKLRGQQQLQDGEDAVPVVVLGGGGGGGSPAAGGVAMDMEEVRACRDLGLDLPCDWTVEIPSYALSGVDTASSGANSPASGSWRISSPGDDPKEVKARLKVWAQAVALASASRLGSS